MFLQVLTIIFVLAKLAGYDMSWWVVFSPAALAVVLEVIASLKDK